MADWVRHIGRPFSLNNMFFNRTTGGRGKTPKYLAWRREQEARLMAAGPRKAFRGPVEIDIYFGAVGVRQDFDTDNGIKGVLDVLVTMGVLPDDSRIVVRRINVSWLLTLDGTEIHVRELTNAAGTDTQAG